MLSTDTRFLGAEWNVQVICIHFLSIACSPALLVVIQKVLTLNHKDVGMRGNEGPKV